MLLIQLHHRKHLNNFSLFKVGYIRIYMRGKLKIPTARQSSYCAILTDQNVNGLQGASCMVARPNRRFFFLRQNRELYYSAIAGLQSDSITLAKHCGKECNQTSTGLDNEAKPAHTWAAALPSRKTKESLKHTKLLLSSRISCQRPDTILKSPLSDCSNFTKVRL